MNHPGFPSKMYPCKHIANEIIFSLFPDYQLRAHKCTQRDPSSLRAPTKTKSNNPKQYPTNNPQKQPNQPLQTQQNPYKPHIKKKEI
jgi:hypothetical protein